MSTTTRSAAKQQELEEQLASILTLMEEQRPVKWSKPSDCWKNRDNIPSIYQNLLVKMRAAGIQAEGDI